MTAGGWAKCCSLRYGSYTRMCSGGYESVMRIHKDTQSKPATGQWKTANVTSEIITGLCYCSSKRGLPKAKCQETGYRCYEKCDLEYSLWQQSLRSSLRAGKPSTWRRETVFLQYKRKERCVRHYEKSTKRIGKSESESE